jgi:hypothetical protein
MAANKQLVAGSTSKFVASKSPNPQTKVLASTNYGKFKALQGNVQQHAYAKQQRDAGHMLPRLGTNGQVSQKQPASSNSQAPSSQQSNLASSYLKNESYLAHNTTVNSSSLKNLQVKDQSSASSQSQLLHQLRAKQATPASQERH